MLLLLLFICLLGKLCAADGGLGIPRETPPVRTGKTSSASEGSRSIDASREWYFERDVTLEDSLRVMDVLGPDLSPEEIVLGLNGWRGVVGSPLLGEYEKSHKGTFHSEGLSWANEVLNVWFKNGLLNEYTFFITGVAGGSLNLVKRASSSLVILSPQERANFKDQASSNKSYPGYEPTESKLVPIKRIILELARNNLLGFVEDKDDLLMQLEVYNLEGARLEIAKLPQPGQNENKETPHLYLDRFNISLGRKQEYGAFLAQAAETIIGHTQEVLASDPLVLKVARAYHLNKLLLEKMEKEYVFDDRYLNLQARTNATQKLLYHLIKAKIDFALRASFPEGCREGNHLLVLPGPGSIISYTPSALKNRDIQDFIRVMPE